MSWSVDAQLHAVDELNVLAHGIVLRGWGLAAAQADRFLVRWPDGQEQEFGRQSWRRASPDVARMAGAAGSDVRFDLQIALPTNLSLDAIQALGLVYRRGDDECLLRPNYLPAPPSRLHARPLADVRLGIGITTYNRAGVLRETIEAVLAHTDAGFTLAVADDGSSDETHQVVRDYPQITLITGPNRGVAWNKNRALYFLNEVERCDVTILLEDDTSPRSAGWQREWLLGALAYGHINYRPTWFPPPLSGRGNWTDPYRCNEVTAQCSAFSFEALDYAGYFDARFGSYGHEHVEHTSRLIRLGYGGELKSDGQSKIFYMLDSDLRMAQVPSYYSQQSVDRNAVLFMTIHGEISYRSPWATEADLLDFRQEIRAAR